MCQRIHPPRPALDHLALGNVAARARARARNVSALARRHADDDAVADQPDGGAGLERFDPSHYEGRKLAGDIALPARELVSTFGHGRHSCPAQRFSISAIRISIRRLLDAYDLSPRFRTA